MEELREKIGRIVNIQHYCYQDGPGVRTTVFVKGCSLHCKWCGNPESISKKYDFSFDKKECVGCKACGKCLQEKKEVFLMPDDENLPPDVNFFEAKQLEPSLSSVCPVGAISFYGKDVSVGEVIDEVDKDFSFYVKSGGGLTISGGEPLLQVEFTKALLQLAHSHGYTTAIESAFCVPWENVYEILPHVDVVMHDIKLMDSKEHKKWTGVGNERILENIKKAYETFPQKQFIVRTPLIPGVNDKREIIEEVLEFILPFQNVKKYELMPYHRLGTGKYESLGKTYEMQNTPSVDEASIRELRELIEKSFNNR